jgi:hypothetical protein
MELATSILGRLLGTRKQATSKGRGTMQESKCFPAGRIVQAGDAEQATGQNNYTVTDICSLVSMFMAAGLHDDAKVHTAKAMSQLPRR